MVSSEEVEMFQLRDGFYLLSVPLGQGGPRPREGGGVTDQEKAVLKKLLSIQFQKRTPAYVGKALSEGEKAVLDGLEKRGFVNVFRGDKYKDGVYNISDNIYPVLSQNAKRAEGGVAPQA